MSTNRDFKGVWIPKEIWLNEELTLLEKIIFVEIDSLDNENHCIAGNEYFAKFCDCSESKVSKAIKKLEELGMIERLEFDGRHRKLRVVKSAMQSSKKCYADEQNLHSNNIDNKQTNKQSNSKELLQNSDFQFGKTKSKPKKDNLFTKCVSLIDSYDFVCWGNIRKLLIDYLNYRISVKDKPLYTNMWKGMLNKLCEICDDNVDMYEQVIKQSIERGYLSFYPVSNYSKSNGIQSESGARHVPRMTEEDYAEEEQRLAELEARGVQVRF